MSVILRRARSLWRIPRNNRSYSTTTTLTTTTPSSSTASTPFVNQPATSTNSPSTEAETITTIFGVKLNRHEHHPGLLNALSLDNASNEQKRKVQKLSIVEKFRRSESDTGSPEVQVALLTEKIKNLTTHLVSNKKDTKKKRNMDILLSQRRRMMKYLFRTSPQRYMALVEELGLRPNQLFANDNRKGAKLAPKRDLRTRIEAQPQPQVKNKKTKNKKKR